MKCSLLLADSHFTKYLLFLFMIKYILRLAIYKKINKNPPTKIQVTIFFIQDFVKRLFFIMTLVITS